MFLSPGKVLEVLLNKRTLGGSPSGVRLREIRPSVWAGLVDILPLRTLYAISPSLQSNNVREMTNCKVF